MSTTKETTVWCDAEGCATWVQVCQRSDHAARNEARRDHGWRHRGGKDYCPEHARGGDRDERTQGEK